MAMVEFWYGAPPGTATPAKAGRAAALAGEASRQHGRVYGACDKCRAILGTMLCRGAGA
jgi:hypothetical protein